MCPMRSDDLLNDRALILSIPTSIYEAILRTLVPKYKEMIPSTGRILLVFNLDFP